MMWALSDRAAPAACRLADRHYSRQKPGSPQFVPPGRCAVFLTEAADAVWVTSWPFAEYVRHAWAGAWVCSIFRNEGGHLASVLIRDALSATRFVYGDPPALGLVTFIDRRKVRPVLRRSVPTWGRTFHLAGFREVGETKGGLIALQILPAAMPGPRAPLGAQFALFEAAP